MRGVGWAWVFSFVVGCSSVEAGLPASSVAELAERLARPDPGISQRLGSRSTPWVAKAGSPGLRVTPAASGMLELAQGSATLELSPVGAQASPLTFEGNRAVYRDLYPSTDAVLVRGSGWVELLWVLRGPEAPARFEWDVRLGGTIRAVRSTSSGSLEFIDAKDALVLRMSRPYGVDAAGRRVEAHAEWTGSRVVVVMDAPKDVTWPVLLDPVVDAAWTQDMPGSSPPGRYEASMATLGEKVVLFGGTGAGGPLADTWEWDGSSWTQLTPATSPPARRRHAMATLGGKVVMFGGDDGTKALEDTWEWDGTDWTQKTPATHPTARRNHAMVGLDANVVLFGGTSDGVNAFSETWAWDGANWTMQVPVTSPPSRSFHAMARLGPKVVMFGGWGPASTLTTLFDTWEWDGSDWTEVNLFGGSRPLYGVMATLGDKVVLVGGGYNAGDPSETWEWDGVSWTKLVLATNPVARGNPAMATLRSDVVLFGGVELGPSGVRLTDTWHFGIDAMGAGLAGSACAVGSDCASRFCVDGVCCNTACGGTTSRDCQACRASAGASADGVCTVLPLSVVCRPSAGVCDVAESCTGLSPTCPVDGFAPATTSCSAPSCANGTATLAANCDWHATCPVAQTSACSPWICGATACTSSCSADADCASGKSCRKGVCGEPVTTPTPIPTPTPQKGCGCTTGADTAFLAALMLLATPRSRRRRVPSPAPRA